MMRPLLKRITLALLLFNVLLLLGYIATRISAFIHIFMPHSGIALTQVEIAIAHNSTTPDPRPQVIPKIIHQIFHNWKDPSNETLPSDWETVRQTCVAFNPSPDWGYKLWTSKLSHDFIATEYPWFLPTYTSFRYPVQKIDALRYFLILHFGGIYLDLDNGCTAPLEPLLYYPVFVTDGGHGALSNNIIGATPNHPFWRLVTDQITSYAWNYPLPYLTVSYATGQWFETAIWEEYHSLLPSGEPPLTRVMMDMRDGAAPWVFFTQERGGTWNEWDNKLFLFIGDHLIKAIVYLMGILAVLATLGFATTRIIRSALQRRKGYRRLGKGHRPSRSNDDMELR